MICPLEGQIKIDQDRSKDLHDIKVFEVRE